MKKFILLALILVFSTTMVFGQTIAEKLTNIYNSKEALRNAIEARYISLHGVPFSEWPDQIDRLQYFNLDNTILINNVELTENISSTDAVVVLGGSGKYTMSKVPTPSTEVPTNALAYGYANTAGTTGQLRGITALWWGPLFPTKKLSITNPTLTTTKTFDGNNTAAVTAGTLSGMVTGHTGVTVSAAATYNDVTAGTGKTITVVYTLAGADAYKYTKPDNYVVTTGVINQKQLTIAAPTVTTTKTFDGNTSTPSTPGALSGLVTGYTTVSTSMTTTFDNANAGSGKTITGVYSISGAHAGNYIKPVNYTSTSGVINSKQLTIAAPTVTTTKTFDGNNTVVATPGSLSGLVSGYTTVTPSLTATYNDALAGTGKTITGVYSISGAHAGNYINPVNYTSTSGVINQKQLTISGSSITGNKVFDGNNTASVPTVGTLGGLVTGYTTVTPACTATYNDALVGSSKTITAVYSISGTHAANYIKPVNYVLTSGAINAKQLTISGTVITTSKVHDGNTTAAVTTVGTLGGLVTGYTTVTPACTATYDNANAGTGKTITAVYSISGTHAGNYIKPVNSTYTTSGVILEPTWHLVTKGIAPYVLSDGILKYNGYLWWGMSAYNQAGSTLSVGGKSYNFEGDIHKYNRTFLTRISDSGTINGNFKPYALRQFHSSNQILRSVMCTAKSSQTFHWPHSVNSSVVNFYRQNASEQSISGSAQAIAGDDFSVSKMISGPSDELVVGGNIYGNYARFNSSSITVSNQSTVGSVNAYITKNNSSGSFLWVAGIYSNINTYIRDITIDGSGNIYISGSGDCQYNITNYLSYVKFEGINGTWVSGIPSSGQYKYIAKLTSSGAHTWSRCESTSADTNSMRLACDSGGSVYIHDNGFLRKFNSTGVIQWTINVNSSFISTFGVREVHVDSNNGVYIAGSTQSSNFTPGADVETWGSLDVFVAKFNTSGTLLWASSLGGFKADYVNKIDTDSNGNIYIAGSSYSEIIFFGENSSDLGVSGNSRAFLAKLRNDGTW